MTRLSGPTALLVVTLCAVCALEQEVLDVVYPQRTIRAAGGSSVTLSCSAHYESEQCGAVHVVWSHVSRNDTELTDPGKYLTTVNETQPAGGMRHRQVVTEVLRLDASDAGRYQCKAQCERGQSAMGHFITVEV